MAGDATVTYRPDPTAIKELGFMPGMRAFTTDIATRYARVAQSLAPVRTGRTKNAIRVSVPGADRESVYTAVAGARSFWHFIEFGTATNPPYAPFRKAAASMGLRFEDPGRGGG